MRVLVVDDSITAREIIISILESDSEIQVIGEARNGKEAIELTRRLKPDLITMDIEMPVLDGLEAIKHIMAYNPTPIVVIAASAFSAGDAFIFKSLEYGALDILEKPTPQEWRDFPKLGMKLIKDIKLLAKVPVITHIIGKRKKKEERLKIEVTKTELLKIVAVASSTGGPPALLQTLGKLPHDFSAGILVVQHIADGFIEGLADWLNEKSKIVVKLAEDGEKIRPGVVLIAPSDFHMVVKKGNTIGLNKEPPIKGLRPAADILFYSVAKYYGGKAMGVILTGMGKDGAKGLMAIKEAGGRTIAQDKNSCVIYGMPRTAVESGAADEIVSINLIAEKMKSFL